MDVNKQLYKLYSADIYRVSWKCNDLISGESWLARKWQFNHTLYFRGWLAAGLINVSGVIFFPSPFKKKCMIAGYSQTYNIYTPLLHCGTQRRRLSSFLRSGSWKNMEDYQK